MANADRPRAGDVMMITQEAWYSVSIYPGQAQLGFATMVEAYRMAQRLALARKSRLWCVEGPEVFQLSRVEMVPRDGQREPARPAPKVPAGRPSLRQIFG